ncbi:permease for cytosine/purines, uracil, thiamine, allantoin-domain-containing protein [Pyronema omphalodes]|nr:permease for cytosine/purines, uracil, thiamine, allantoin-domain-containing protein [Pyronema omphalodes]
MNLKTALKNIGPLKIKNDKEGGEATRYSNKELVPVAVADRTYGWNTFFGYWVVTGVNASAWSLGSANMANGLSPAEVCGAVLIGAFCSGLIAFFCGEPGVQYHLGFPMMSRATFGIYGSYFVVALKVFANLIFFGVQAFWGGQAVRVCLGALSPQFLYLKNTLPASALLETADLVGLIVYLCVFFPLLLFRPAKLTGLILTSFIVVSATIFGVLIFAVRANGGAGNLFRSPSAPMTSAEKTFKMFQCISAVCGSWIGNCIRQSDWTRFATGKRSAVSSQLLAAPVTITLTALIGIVVTSATSDFLGKKVWQPILLLTYIQKHDYSAAIRAGTFFAGFGWFVSQLSINVIHNSVAAGMDLSAMIPEYINVRRGAIIMAVIGIVINPWRFVYSPGTFITVLSSFGLFTAPAAGPLIVDFWIVRRKRWNVPHLFVGNEEGTYWYWRGVNWRAFAAWTVATIPSLRK